MTEFPLAWEVILTDVAEGERESLFLNVGKARGPDYARCWLTRLVDTTEAIAEFPGPRSFPQSHPESEHRREEVRYRIYGGPDTKATLSVSCHIFFAIFDARQGEALGRILILRIIASQTEAVSQLLGKTT